MCEKNSESEDLFYLESSSELDPNKNKTGDKVGEGSRNETTVANNDDMGNLAQSETESDKANVYNVDRRSDSGMNRNQMSQLPVQHMLFKPSVNIVDIENMIAPFDGSVFQNIDAWLENFEDVSSM